MIFLSIFDEQNGLLKVSVTSQLPVSGHQAVFSIEARNFFVICIMAQKLTPNRRLKESIPFTKRAKEKRNEINGNRETK